MPILANLGSISAAPVLWSLLGMLGAIGALAVISPRWFCTLSTRSNRWVDTAAILARLDRRIDIDRYVLPFSRVLGVLVLLAVALIAVIYANYSV